MCCRPKIAAVLLGVTIAVFSGAAIARAEDAAGPPVAWDSWPHPSGVYPHLAALARSNSESGIGAVVPWADRLWYISYVAHKSGSDVGLFEISPDLSIRRRPESIVGTHAGRMIHRESNQLIIGPYVIDAKGNVRVFDTLARTERVTAVMRHLTDPGNKVYIQAMEGDFYEADLRTLESKRLFDMRKELGIRGAAHFKGGYTAQGRVVVANNSYDAGDAKRGSGEGRLAEWDGKTWTTLQRTAFCDVTTVAGVEAVADDRAPLYAIGWDMRSILLAVLTDGKWTTYRLPKGSQAYDHAWCTEWPRIRAVGPGELMLDMHGLFYAMSPQFRAGKTGGLTPTAFHLRMTPDFCLWSGRLVLAGNENTAMGHRCRTGGQPQSNLWFGSLAELKTWGKPSGWGGPWRQDAVQAGVPSEPFLIHGFTRRVLHLAQGKSGGAATFTLEIDNDGSGTWTKYTTITVPAGGYAYHILPDDLPACWLRITSDRETVATAEFFFGPQSAAETKQRPAALFASFSAAEKNVPRIHGALLPLADRLWFVSYTSDAQGRAHEGGGLYEIDKDLKFVRRKESLRGIFANRKMIDGLLSIGPHLIEDNGTIRTFQALAGEHIASSIRHPDARKMYFLTADGRLLEGDISSLEIRPVADIPQSLQLKDARLRFKGGHLAGKTVLVAATAQDGQGGCLAEWEGTACKLVDRAAFGEISNLGAMSETVFATGSDKASALLKVRTASGHWSTYRLPKANGQYEHALGDQWPRIREVETERMLMDVHGICYETTGIGYAWYVRPVATHGRVLSDYCSWRGLTVLAGSDAAAKSGPNYRSGGKDVGLWFGKTDDLWQFGKPVGVGGPWLNQPVRAGEPSDPYLMTGFEEKEVELSHQADRPVEFTVEVDILGTPHLWKVYKKIVVPPGEKVTHRFPDGFSAHWVRVSADTGCKATAQFTYR